MSIMDYMPGDCCQFTLFPHIILCLALIGSAIPSKWQVQSRIAFHGLFGLLLYVAPCALAGPKVGHKVDTIPLFLKRFSGAIQIGFAYYYFRTRHNRSRPEPAFALAKALAAGLIFAHEFCFKSNPAIGHTYDLKSPRFYFCIILVELTYAIVEALNVMRFFYNANSPYELEAERRRAQRPLESAGLVRTQYLFWMDAVACLCYAVMSIASTDYFYFNLIKCAGKVDSVCRLFNLEFGYYALGTAILSLLAPQFNLYHQRMFVEMRLIIQTLIFSLHLYGTFFIYPFGQFMPHIIAMMTLGPLYQIKMDIDSSGMVPEGMTHENGHVLRSGREVKTD